MQVQVQVRGRMRMRMRMRKRMRMRMRAHRSMRPHGDATGIGEPHDQRFTTGRSGAARAPEAGHGPTAPSHPGCQTRVEGRGAAAGPRASMRWARASCVSGACWPGRFGRRPLPGPCRGNAWRTFAARPSPGPWLPCGPAQGRGRRPAAPAAALPARGAGAPRAPGAADPAGEPPDGCARGQRGRRQHRQARSGRARWPPSPGGRACCAARGRPGRSGRA